MYEKCWKNRVPLLILRTLFQKIMQDTYPKKKKQINFVGFFQNRDFYQKCQPAPTVLRFQFIAFVNKNNEKNQFKK